MTRDEFATDGGTSRRIERVGALHAAERHFRRHRGAAPEKVQRSEEGVFAIHDAEFAMAIGSALAMRHCVLFGSSRGDLAGAAPAHCVCTVAYRAPLCFPPAHLSQIW